MSRGSNSAPLGAGGAGVSLDLRLGRTQAAIIFDEDGTVASAIIPDQPGDANTYRGSIVVAALLVLPQERIDAIVEESMAAGGGGKPS